MGRKLKLWNGRWFDGRGNIYVAAYSVADVKFLLKEWLGYEPRGIAGEIRNYWSAGHWGNAMSGVTPERGVWVSKGGYPESPVRAYPPEGDK